MANKADVADHLRTIEVDGFVYFVRPENSRYVKIGWSKNVRDRVYKLQTSHPTKLKVLLALPGSLGLEQRLHQQFADKRRRGEWFILDNELRAFIIESGGVWTNPIGSYSKANAATEDEVRQMLAATERTP